MPRQFEDVKLYTINEIAEMLDVTRATVLKFIKRKQLKYKRIGRLYFVSDKNLKQFLRKTD